MTGAILTSFFWAISAVSGQRAARAIGSLRANVVRLLMAFLLLTLWTALFHRDSFALRPSAWLFLSGIIGFGIGDVALYLALARIGSRLTVLITFCFAPVLAVLVEWQWLGQVPPPGHLAIGALILAGVVLTVKPSSPSAERYGSFGLGLGMGLISAAGQGIGAVLTRVANAEAATLGLSIAPMSQAFQRVAGGTLFGAVAFVILRLANRVPRPVPPLGPRRVHPGWWLWCAALTGPVVGVAFYQWALQSTTSGVVLAIVSLTPVLVMPLAYWLERDRPTAWQWAGAVLASGGVILLKSMS